MITPSIDYACPPAQTPEVIAYVREGRARGKVVITI
jgi:hypothetical protein